MSLHTSICDRVTNVALSALLASSPGIQCLSLYWNLNVTNDALFAAAALCPGLRAVNLSGCKNVTDAGVRALALGCSGITALDLTRCRAGLRWSPRILICTSAGDALLSFSCLFACVAQSYAPRQFQHRSPAGAPSLRR